MSLVSVVLLTAAGAGLVVLALVDVFYTVLFPASGRGPLRRRLERLVRSAFACARRLRDPGRRRRLLAYAGPVEITVTLLVWMATMVLGWALVYLPALGDEVVAASGDTDATFGTAVYFSGYVLTTLGMGDVVATEAVYRWMTVVEAATGFAVLTLVISYFNSVYGTLIGRNAFATALHDRGGSGAGVVVALWREGEVAAALHLAEMAASMRMLTQTHRSYPVLWAFHHQEDRYAFPRMLETVCEASALLRSTVRPPAGGRPELAGSALEECYVSAIALCEQQSRSEVGRPTAADRETWSREHQEVTARLAAAGVPVRRDAGAREEYVEMRGQWEMRLRGVVDELAYDWR